MIRRLMATVARLKALIVGRARDPLRADTRRHMALVAFGGPRGPTAYPRPATDRRGVSCAGRPHPSGPYLALAKAVTVFIKRPGRLVQVAVPVEGWQGSSKSSTSGAEHQSDGRLYVHERQIRTVAHNDTFARVQQGYTDMQRDPYPLTR